MPATVPLTADDLRSPRDELRQSILDLGVHQGDELIISSSSGTQRWLIDLRGVFLRRENLLALRLHLLVDVRQLSAFSVGGDGNRGHSIAERAAVDCARPITRRSIESSCARIASGRDLAASSRATSPDDPVILIDDILNSATSAEKARSIVAAHGGRVLEMVVVIDYRSKRGSPGALTRTSMSERCSSSPNLPFPCRPTRRRLDRGTASCWQVDIPGGFPFHIVPKSAPVLADGTIFRDLTSAKMQAFDAETGRVIWDFQATGVGKPGSKGIWSTPAVPCRDGSISAPITARPIAWMLQLDQPIWSQSFCEWIGASPLVVPKHGLVYSGLEFARPWAQGALCALDVTTGEKGVGEADPKISARLAGLLGAGRLSSFGAPRITRWWPWSRGTGKTAWSFKTGRSVRYAPAISDTRGIVALRPSTSISMCSTCNRVEKIGSWETGEICYTTPLLSETACSVVRVTASSMSSISIPWRS